MKTFSQQLQLEEVGQEQLQQTVKLWPLGQKHGLPTLALGEFAPPVEAYVI